MSFVKHTKYLIILCISVTSETKSNKIKIKTCLKTHFLFVAPFEQFNNQQEYFNVTASSYWEVAANKFMREDQ